MEDDRGDKLCSPRLPGTKFVLCAKIINYVEEKVDYFILHLHRSIRNGISFMSGSLPLPSSLKKSLLKVYLTWVSNNLVLKDQGKKLVDSMGCEFGLHFDYTLSEMEKVERQSIIAPIVRYKVFCKM